MPIYYDEDDYPEELTGGYSFKLEKSLSSMDNSRLIKWVCTLRFNGIHSNSYGPAVISLFYGKDSSKDSISKEYFLYGNSILEHWVWAIDSLPLDRLPLLINEGSDSIANLAKDRLRDKEHDVTLISKSKDHDILKTISLHLKEHPSEEKIVQARLLMKPYMPNVFE